MIPTKVYKVPGCLEHRTVDAGYKQLGYKETRLLPTNFLPPAKLLFVMYYKNSDTRNSLIRKLGYRKANFLSRLLQKLGYKKPKAHVHFQENFTHSKKPKVHFLGQVHDCA